MNEEIISTIINTPTPKEFRNAIGSAFSNSIRETLRAYCVLVIEDNRQWLEQEKRRRKKVNGTE